MTADFELVIIGEESAEHDDPWRALRESGLPPCFGKRFAKTVHECNECLAPVIHNGKIQLVREVCEAVTRERKGR